MDATLKTKLTEQLKDFLNACKFVHSDLKIPSMRFEPHAQQQPFMETMRHIASDLELNCGTPFLSFRGERTLQALRDMGVNLDRANDLRAQRAL